MARLAATDWAFFPVATHLTSSLSIVQDHGSRLPGELKALPAELNFVDFSVDGEPAAVEWEQATVCDAAWLNTGKLSQWALEALTPGPLDVLDGEVVREVVKHMNAGRSTWGA
eukprot:949599-Amphidinium_carterae.1